MAEAWFLTEAEEDYTAAVKWYKQRSAQAAEGFESAMEGAIERIEKSPESYPFTAKGHRYFNLRRYPYSVIYRSTPDKILIVAVAHASRDPVYWHHRA